MKNDVYVIYKPINWTSNQVLVKLKKTLNLKKIGHGGTLDPLADGVLIVAINENTKLLQQHLHETKEYITDITFGFETSTLDLEGEIIKTNDEIKLNINDIKNALFYFKNEEYYQTPPSYSAVKINGKPAYSYARNNISIKLEPKKVRLLNYEIINFNDNVLTLKLEVSKGFYVRSFASDLAHYLNTCGTITKLTRTKSGPYSIQEAKTIEEFIDEYQKYNQD